MLVASRRQGLVIGLMVAALQWSEAGAQEPATQEPGSGDVPAERQAAEVESVSDDTAEDTAEDSLEGYTPPVAEPEVGEAVVQDEFDPSVDELPPMPPPGPPQNSEQLPTPVPEDAPADPSRRAVLGFYAGAVQRSSEDDRVTYGTSFAFGPSAAVEMFPWLRALAYARFEEIPVEARSGAFDTHEYQYPNTSIEQPTLDSIGVGFRVAPTLVVNARLRIMAAFDIAWNRFKAAPPVTKGNTHVRSAERAGVGLNYKAGLGVAFEPILHWFEISAVGAYGVFTSQDGTAFDDVLQGFDQTGNIVHLAPLPRFERSFELIFSASVIL